MAIDWWSLRGKPSSYNPLPIGFGNSARIPNGDFLFLVRAKSPSGARLRAYTNPSYTKDTFYPLSSEFKDYTFEIGVRGDDQAYIHDLSSVGDIVIESVKLIEKPVPVRGGLGVPRVKVPKGKNWFPNKITDYEIGSVASTNGTNTPNVNYIRTKGYFPILPKQYVLSCLAGRFWFSQYRSDFSFIRQNSLPDKGTLTFPADCVYVRFEFQLDMPAILDQKVFKTMQPQLEQGSIPTSYEPYQETLPSPKRVLAPKRVQENKR
jgi:hypothetical protein